jgi:hypothetical protein
MEQTPEVDEVEVEVESVETEELAEFALLVDLPD